MRRALRAMVYLKELRDALRDRRTAIMVLVASILTGPLTLVLVAQFVSGLEEKARHPQGARARHARGPRLDDFTAGSPLVGASGTYRFVRRQTDHAASAETGRAAGRAELAAPASTRCAARSARDRRRATLRQAIEGAGSEAAAAIDAYESCRATLDEARGVAGGRERHAALLARGDFAV